jgi:amidase
MGLAELVRKKQVSPKELVEATIKRIEALDGKINAVVTRTFERALAAVDKVDLDAPLAGVPYLLKDNIDVAGVRTSNGSAVYKDNIPTVSAPMVKAHETAGLIITGKTNMPEVGLIPSTESKFLGACHNPWELGHSAGGSSGGSAAAVAAGYLPVAHASDGGGSIRIPASCCGVFGVKPSRRRMLPGSSDQTEFMVDNCVSRTVRDSALLFSLTQNRSSDAPFKPLEFVSGPSKRRLKIGLSIQDYFSKMPHEDVRKAIEATAKLSEDLGHTVVDTENPINGSEFEEHFLAIFSEKISKLVDAVTAIAGKPAAESGLLERFTIDFEAKGRSMGSDGIEKAKKYMDATGVKVAQWMQSFDLVLTPVLSTPPPKLGYLFDPTQDYEVMSRRVFDYLPYTPVQNALGLPAMSVPLGMSSEDLPIGSHFTAKAGDEKTLFELAYELEQAKPWADQWAPNFVKAKGS